MFFSDCLSVKRFCRSLLVLVCLLMLLSACQVFTGVSPSSGPVVNELTSPAGQLFCRIDNAGGSEIVGVVDASASGLGTVGAPIAVLATNAGAAMVAQECSAAAAAESASTGTPVSPPSTAVPNVAIQVPAGAPTSAAPTASAPS